jgi:hypothetical protein
MKRFVLLEHDHPVLHWDFMLEIGAALRTWRLAAPPASGQTCAARQLADHRLAYLDYEGPVSGGRGFVTRWDWGTYEGQGDGEEKASLRLIGQRLRGVMELTRLSGEEWQATFRADG